MRVLHTILVLLLVVGCDLRPPTPVAGLGSVDESEKVGWRLAAAYDIAPLIADPTAEGAETYLWLANLGMEQYCGPSRRPSGMGVFEAEAMATGLTPTLALILERTSPRETVPAESIRVAVGTQDRKILLQPAVERRHLAVRITGVGPEVLRYQQLVRTQLEIELCLEHKLGRGWTGADTDLLREAFLLDPPRVGTSGGNPARSHDDRIYFGGQGAPVPALLGPPDACLLLPKSARPAPPSDTVVAGYELVPSDVWSAGLRRCDDDTEGEGKIVQRSPHTSLPLRLRPQGKPVAPPPTEVWRELTVDLRSAEDPQDVEITVNYADNVWGPEALIEPTGAGATRSDPGDGEGGLRDILARLPRTYPRVGPEDDPERYAVLLIPNWQIVDALRAIETGSPEETLDSPGSEPRNGVASLLERPDLLYVQVPPPGAQASSDTAPTDWPDLSSTMGPGKAGARFWGYTVGFVAGRAPIVLIGDTAPSWDHERRAQRARPQSFFIFATSVLLIVLLVGLRRLPDIWSRVPEVAMDYWPGLVAGEEEETGQEEAAAETAAKLTAS